MITAPEGDADELLAAAAALAGVAGLLAGARRRHRTAAGLPPETWAGGRREEFGAAASAAGAVLGDVESDLAQLVAGLQGLARRLRETTDEVAEQRRLAAAGVDPDRCAEVAAAAKDDYARAAAAFAASVGSLTPAGAAPLAQVVPLALAAHPPATVALWWRGLSAAQQSATAAAYPGLVGGLDGLPAAVRDRANRILLPRLQAEVRERLRQLAAEQHGYEPYGRGLSLPARETADLERKLRAFEVLRRVLALPDRQLLLLDPWQGHDLHAAVAVGDVDRARDVAVFVPGMTSSVQQSLVGYDAAMVDLRERAGVVRTAAVTWLGYDAPQLGDVLLGWLSVGSAHLARVGGDRLAGFLGGLRHDAHLTVLGHSYGSLTSCYALRHRATGVDDLVLFGSPGTGVDDVHRLHVPPGHLWDLSAPEDPVAAVQRFGTLPSMLPGFRVLASGDEPGLAGVTGHTHYLDPGTTSQHNIAAVVSGHPEDLLLAPDVGQPEHLAVYS